jgi:hypothetical protein
VLPKDVKIFWPRQVDGLKGGIKSYTTDPGKPDGIHFMEKEKCDSMSTVDCVTKAGEASFCVQKNNNEWYVLAAMHSSKVLVRVSGKDDDERYIELEAMLPSKTEDWCGNTKSKISFQLTRDGFRLV